MYVIEFVLDFNGFIFNQLEKKMFISLKKEKNRKKRDRIQIKRNHLLTYGELKSWSLKNKSSIKKFITLKAAPNFSTFRFLKLLGQWITRFTGQNSAWAHFTSNAVGIWNCGTIIVTSSAGGQFLLEVDALPWGCQVWLRYLGSWYRGVWCDPTGRCWERALRRIRFVLEPIRSESSPSWCRWAWLGRRFPLIRPLRLREIKES